MAGRDLAMHRMMPADQRLGAALPFGGEVVLGLIDDLELLASERQPQLMLDHAPALQRLVHALLEEAHALPAVALGAGESDAGMTEHDGAVSPSAGASAMPTLVVHQDVLVADLERPPQSLDQAVHEGHDVAEIGDVDERNGEFVAAQSRKQVALAQAGLECGRRSRATPGRRRHDLPRR